MPPRELLVDGTYFTFPHGWHTEIFDEWPQYGKVKNLGIKGCDVVALDGDDLWIIEMKDYTYLGANPPDILHQTVALKAVGTMALLYALARSASDSPARDFAIKCSANTRIHLALHVEVKDAGRREEQVQAVLAPLLQKLKKTQKALGLHKAHVTSTLAPSSNTPWTARRNPETRGLHVDR